MSRMITASAKAVAAFVLVSLGFLVYVNVQGSSKDQSASMRQAHYQEQEMDKPPNRSGKHQALQRIPDIQYQHGHLTIATNDNVARILHDQVRVLCWIAVSKETLDRAAIVQQTWGRRCTKLVLIGDQETKDLPEVVTLDVPTGRKYLWPKTREAFRHVYQNHLEDADWFLKADTDTYVIMENLRSLLSQQDLTKPHYLGCNIQLYIKDGYNSGGAGYALNRAALKLLVNNAYNDTRCYKGYMEDEDVSMGYCMSTVGVIPGDPTDSRGKNRFFPFEPADHVSPAQPGANGWYWRATFKPGEKNMSCCSDTWISFHYVSPQLLWNMEFLLYHSNIIGINTLTTLVDKV